MMELDYRNVRTYRKVYSHKIKIERLLWCITWNLLIRPLPRVFFRRWCRFIYRLFGATIPSSSSVFPSVKVFMPWKLKMGKCSVIGNHSVIYNTADVTIGNGCVISEGAYLCTTSHSTSSPFHEQIDAPISIGDNVWIATQAFVKMGVNIGDGAVAGARSVVCKNIEPWTIVGGNPARFIKKREISDSSDGE